MAADAHAPGVSAGRLIGFSDAVVAIGITLLVLPLIELVPEAAGDAESAIDVVKQHLTPIYCFLVTFAVIWRIWRVHHEVFAEIETVSGPVAFVNMLWLACIVFLPFPVDLIGTYGSDRFVLGLYVGVLLLSSIALSLMTALLRRTGEAGSVPGPGVARSTMGNTIALALAMVVVLAVPSAGFWPLLMLLLDGPALAAWRRFSGRAKTGTAQT